MTKTNDLGSFLKARRTELKPEDVGLVADHDERRRAQGLRREEVAALASISADYYTRIEQGRRSAPWSTLESIARALRLDGAGREYLWELASAGEPRQLAREQQTSAHLQHVIDDLGTTPALVLGRRMDILAWNRLGEALMMVELASVPRAERNYVRLMFTRPEVRALHADWETVGRLCVAQLHMEVARDQRDARLAELVADLSERDEDFRRWWGAHKVAVRSRGEKVFLHPLVGELRLAWDTMTSADDPDQQLITWTAAPGSDADEKLLRLAELVQAAPSGSSVDEQAD